MLDTAVKFLADEVNAHLRTLSLSRTNDGEVVPGHVVDESGKWTTPPDNIGLTLLNVEEERTAGVALSEKVYVNGTKVLIQPELMLNLSVLFHIRYSPGRYEQSLRHLSNVMAFFQRHNSFRPEEYPALDLRIERLEVDMLTWSTEQMNQVWSCLGSRHLPSLAYRLRMTVLRDMEPAPAPRRHSGDRDHTRRTMA